MISLAFRSTRQILAEACGLSFVHFNRTAQELRRGGLIEWKGGLVTLFRRKELARVAEPTPKDLQPSAGKCT
jgi:CRP-like cAMP-binding protein